MFTWKNKKLESGKITKQVVSNATAYFILATAGIATAFFGVCSPRMSQVASLSGNAATVGHEEITGAEFKRTYQNMVRQYQSIYQDKFDPGALKLAENVLNDLVNQMLAYQQAKELGFCSSGKEIEDLIFKQFRDESGEFDIEYFKNYLKMTGYSEASLTSELIRRNVADKFRRFVSESSYYAPAFSEIDYKIGQTKLDIEFLRLDGENIKVSVTSDEVNTFLAGDGGKKAKEYFDSHLSDYKKEKKVRASHILVSYKESRNVSGPGEKRSKDEAKKLAEKILSEVKSSPNNFAELAKKYTDEASGKSKGGDLGFFGRDDMVKEFSDVAYGLQVGQVSDLVDSPFGFHIIKVTGIQEAFEKTFDQVKEDIARKLLTDSKKPEVLKRRADEILALLTAGKSAQSQISEYGLSWKATGEFGLESRSMPTIGADENIMNAAAMLRSQGEVAKTSFDHENAKYIIRLKSRKDADLNKLDEKKREELAREAVYEFGGTLYRELTKQYEEKMKKNGQIKLNDEFLAIDRRSSKQDESGG